LDKFLSRNRASLRTSLLSTEDLCRFDDLKNDGIYVVISPYFTAVRDERLRRQVDDKVLEVEAAKSVARALGGNPHIHNNFKFEDISGQKFEADGVVVHQGGENEANSSVYFIECGYNPELVKVKGILKRLEDFKTFAKNSQHFRNTTAYFPVFGAKNFDPSIDRYCADNSIWQVRPSGGGYALVKVPAFRNFSTFIRRILK